MKRFAFLFAALLLVAATPSEVVPQLEAEGYFIEQGSDASGEVVGDAVAEAGFAGSRFYIAVLSEEPSSSATFFADALLDDLGDGTVLVVAPETVGWASLNDIWSQEQLDQAVEVSLSGSSDDDVVTLFTESLIEADVTPGGGGGENPAPGPSPTPVPDTGGSGFIWFLVIAGGFVALFFYLRNRSSTAAGTARAARLEEFRTAAQAKLNDIANDILEMEDEVRLSENLDVRKHYDSASRTYTDLIDRIDDASATDDLVEITHQLDVAIWELDVAESYLDGKPAPKKPEKPVVPTPEAPRPTPAPRPTSTFDRRPQRQSSPAGPDLGSILMAILAAQSLGGGRGTGPWGSPTSKPPGPGGFGGGSGGGMRGGGGGGRMRGGGRRGG